MRSHFTQDFIECANPEGGVARDRNVVFTVSKRCQAHMAANLARYFLVVLPQQTRQFLPT